MPEQTPIPEKSHSDTTLRSAVTPVWSWRGLIAAVAAVVLAVALAVFVNAAPRNSRGAGVATGSEDAASSSQVAATGETTKVTVHATGDWHFEPSSIDVPAGNRLEITLVNDDPKSGHDLQIGDAATPRVQPGKSAVLDAGVIRASVLGTCTVAGHEQMGMTLRVNAVGAPQGGGARAEGSRVEGSGAAGSSSADSHEDHGAGVHPAAIPDVAGATIKDPIPAELPPLEPGTVHRVTLTVREMPLEVAPGLYQTRWTYNGKQTGPILRGRVGDTFEVTLVNEGSIGHSIDFHAGAISPDEPMRTIAPGEKLVYKFRAERAGIWMYHCSTAPMSTHIAAGMHGAVIVEPQGLDRVDHEYAIVQSEVYLANAAHSPAEAREVNAAAIGQVPPSRTVFNGIARQYVDNPLRVKPGERVRFWVLDAGPNFPLSFHVVGGQFDTVWTEGASTLRGGEAYEPAGGTGAARANNTTRGGAQVLPLLPAQGGFVELTLKEPGNYSFVNHMMSEAERGAKGIIKVGE